MRIGSAGLAAALVASVGYPRVISFGDRSVRVKAVDPAEEERERVEAEARAKRREQERAKREAPVIAAAAERRAKRNAKRAAIAARAVNK